MSYQVRLAVFEGPLDLLLCLIRNQELDIYDIPIAQITQQYLDYLELMQQLNLNVAGEFLVMAATLMQIKARMLLPSQPLEEEEDGGGEDPRVELVRQLLEYEQYKEAAAKLRERAEEFGRVYTRVGADSEDAADTRTEWVFEVSLFDLMGALKSALDRFREGEGETLAIEEASVTERIAAILEMLQERPSLLLDELFNDLRSRREVLVTFLAVLELVRLKAIRVRQSFLFGPIRLMRAVESTT